MNWYLAVLKNYAGFEGRARRMEFWMFTLINAVIIVVLEIIAAVLGDNGGIIFYILVGLYGLAVLIPTIAVQVRRLHDTNRSGWWYFIGFVPLVGGIILLVFSFTAGTPGPNQYGPDPKQSAAYA